MLLGEKKVNMPYIHVVYTSISKVFVRSVKKSLQLVYPISGLDSALGFVMVRIKY